MPLPRRRLLLFSTLLFAPFAGAATEGQDAPSDAGGERFNPTWTTEAHHREAVRLLNRGVNFERAILHARAAATKDAANPNHHLALGCACASRAASLIHASAFTWRYALVRRNYESRLRQPEEAGGGDSPRPVPPPARLAFPTKDDQRPFTLAPVALEARLESLFAEAMAAFEDAGRRDGALPPAERAEARYIRGWGFLTLQFYASVHESTKQSVAQEEAAPHREIGSPTPAAARKPLPHPRLADAVAALREATELAPENAAYWQSLGDVLEIVEQRSPLDVPTPAFDDGRGLRELRDAAKGADGRAWTSREAYQNSLRLYRRNAALWSRMAQAAIDEGEPPGSTQRSAKGRAAAREYRAAAAKADPASAVLQYLLAAAHIDAPVFDRVASEGRLAEAGSDTPPTPQPTAAQQQAVRKALRLVEQGNRAGRVPTDRYALWPPKMLAAALNYATPFIYEPAERFTVWTIYVKNEIEGYAVWCARRGDSAEARRAVRALFAMGQKLVGKWPLRDAGRNTGEVYLCEIGAGVLVTALTAQESCCQALGDLDGAASASRDLAALHARREAWEEERRAALTPDYDYFLYY